MLLWNESLSFVYTGVGFGAKIPKQTQKHQYVHAKTRTRFCCHCEEPEPHLCNAYDVVQANVAIQVISKVSAAPTALLTWILTFHKTANAKHRRFCSLRMTRPLVPMAPRAFTRYCNCNIVCFLFLPITPSVTPVALQLGDHPPRSRLRAGAEFGMHKNKKTAEYIESGRGVHKSKLFR